MVIKSRRLLESLLIYSSSRNILGKVASPKGFVVLHSDTSETILISGGASTAGEIQSNDRKRQVRRGEERDSSASRLARSASKIFAPVSWSNPKRRGRPKGGFSPIESSSPPPPPGFDNERTLFSSHARARSAREFFPR